jgi:hypothetical protein
MQPPVSAERPIIFSLHGIRTGGAWQKADLTRVLSEAGFDHLALDFGFFRALRLLRPAARRRQVDWFRDRYTAEMRGRSSLPSIIAHSFGTYIVAEAMRIYPEVCFNQVILCGSIVRQDFPWSKLIDSGRVQRVLNDCGQRDFWAGIVVWAVDDAGPSGVKGFSDTAGGLVIQRSHPDWRHSDFFYELNYRRNWTPFLQGNMPGPPGTAAGRTTNWRFRLAVLMCLALLATLGSILWPTIRHFPSSLVTSPQLPRLETPRLSRPFDNTLFKDYPRTTTLRWLPIKGATHYLVEVQYQLPTNGQWYDLPGYPLAVQEDSYTFQFIGAQPGRWRVSAVGPEETKSEPSKWWYFTYQQ